MPGGSGGARWSRYVTITAIVVGCSGGEASDPPSQNALGYAGFPGWGGQVPGQGGTPGTAGIPQQQIPPPGPLCGNGVIDPGEQCEGSTAQTCIQATMGARPVGNVACTNCYIDTNGCTAQLAPPPTGAGGSGGDFGGPPVNPPPTTTTPPPTNPPPTTTTPPPTTTTPPPTNPPPTTGGGPTNLPTATNCPNLVNGATVQIARKNGSMMPVIIYIDPNAKSKPEPGGPIINYWHATGSNPAEVHSGFGDANIQQVTSMGGVVAAYTTTACSGCSTTDDLVWFVEDDDVQDTLVACAIQQAKIDVRHIHALGWSAGALHSDHVALARNNYMASVISYSGGQLFPVTLPDPNAKVATIQTYGTTGDAVVIDFPTQSKAWYNTYQPKGWYTMMCKHAGGHAIDTGVAPVSLKFFMDHPYGVSPEPYANAIPAGFPSYCGNTIQ